MSVDRLRIRAAFPFWTDNARRWKRCLEAVSWDTPAGDRESSRPKRAMCLTAAGCHPPKVSTGSGIKEMR